MLDQARRDNNGNLCMALLISCLDVIYQVGMVCGGGQHCNLSALEILLELSMDLCV